MSTKYRKLPFTFNPIEMSRGAILKRVSLSELSECSGKKAEQRTFEKIVYYILLILTPPRTVIVIF